jgi:soluble lytic murein transglycosylase-like protein
MATPKISTITTYNSLIQSSAEKYLLDVDWRLVKAQAYQESKLNPTAVSPAGAVGIAQFMQGTWNDMKKQMSMPTNASPLQPVYAIPALCFYMAKLHGQWTAKRTDADRYALALASYNAGIGNLLDAQRLAGNANEYHQIIAQLHRVTGDKNARETRTYVERIFGYFVEQIIRG